ncbi:50S ribosomal protein L23 [Candidatus Micrarchaeota archaeon]|nr:50S ribosomal protein L23 [Candidatus Micrarchaeota archaeon]
MVLKRLVSSEKGVRELENNILLFVVEKNSTKDDIRKEIESKFKVKVYSVKTFNNLQGEKRAYIKLTKEHSASDIADKIGGAV